MIYDTYYTIHLFLYRRVVTKKMDDITKRSETKPTNPLFLKDPLYLVRYLYIKKDMF